MGISDIQKNRDQEVQDRKKFLASNKELRLLDGDTATFAIIPTGDDNDNKLGHFYVYTESGTTDSGKKFANPVFVGVDSKEAYSSGYDRKQIRHQFAFWAYVYTVMRQEKPKTDNFVEKKLPSGGVRYEEAVNDVKLVRLGFGKSDSVWQQLVNIYNENNSLSINLVRLGRKGSGMLDTVYTFIPTDKKVKIPDEKVEEIKNLPNIHAYAKEFLISSEERNSSNKSDESKEVKSGKASSDEELDDPF